MIPARMHLDGRPIAMARLTRKELDKQAQDAVERSNTNEQTNRDAASN